MESKSAVRMEAMCKLLFYYTYNRLLVPTYLPL
jgi:hypothetical protein